MGGFQEWLSCLAQEGISWMLESHNLDLNPGSVTTSRETGTVGTSPDEASGLLTVSPTHKQQQQQQNQAESTSRSEFVSGLYWSRLYTLKTRCEAENAAIEPGPGRDSSCVFPLPSSC